MHLSAVTPSVTTYPGGVLIRFGGFSGVDIPAWEETSDDVHETKARRQFYGSLLGVNVEHENTLRWFIGGPS